MKIGNKMKLHKYWQTLILLICVILFLVACDNTTKVKTGSLKGKVVLTNDTGDPSLDPYDFAGVTVSVYELAEYDYDLKSFLSKYPSVGFALTQNSEFDHHEGVVVAQTISKEDGSFDLKKIPVGEYNIVFEKSGWGYRYVYNVQTSEGENQLKKYENVVELFPERTITGNINVSIVVEDWHHLIVEDDASFMPQSYLKLGNNGIMRINRDTRLDIYGNVCLQGSHEEFFQIKVNRSNDEELKVNEYVHFNIMSGSTIDDQTIEYGRISGGIRGVGLSSVAAALIRNCRFLITNEGIYSTQGIGFGIEKCVFTGIENNIGHGVIVYNDHETNIKDNCFMSLSKGVEAVASKEVLMRNNGFVKTNYGIESYDTESDIQYNNFEENKVSIRVAGTSSPSIQYNQIDSEQGVIIGKNMYFIRCTPLINNNNISTDRHAIIIVHHNYDDINAQNNYFYSTDAQTVRDKIKHKPDYPESQQHQIGNIIFRPFLFSRVRNAGIVSK